MKTHEVRHYVRQHRKELMRIINRVGLSANAPKVAREIHTKSQARILKDFVELSQSLDIGLPVYGSVDEFLAADFTPTTGKAISLYIKAVVSASGRLEAVKDRVFYFLVLQTDPATVREALLYRAIFDSIA